MIFSISFNEKFFIFSSIISLKSILSSAIFMISSTISSLFSKIDFLKYDFIFSINESFKNIFNSGFFSNTLFFSFSPIILSSNLSKTSSLITLPSFSFAVICSTEISSFSIVSARFSDILSRFLGINPCILKNSRFTSL